MKYTREQVKAMTQEEYESAICKELNNAGFRQEFDGEQSEYEPDNPLLAVPSHSTLRL